MKLQGFIGPAYTLDSVNVDAQRCVNLYPEVIESGRGKEGQVAYLKSTPGLEKVVTIGDGPIRLIHRDSIGRIFVVSKNKLYRLAQRSDWTLQFYTPNLGYDDFSLVNGAIDDSNDNFSTTTGAIDDLYTGMKVQVTTADTLPGGLSLSTDYWIIVEDATHFQLASTFANAVAGTAIDLTSTGVGSITFHIQNQQLGPQFSISYENDIDFDDNSFAEESHGLHEGLRVRVATIATPLPTNLDFSTDYYVIKTDDDNFKLASSPSNVQSGTAIDIQDIEGQWGAVTFKYNQSLNLSQSATDAVFDTSSGLMKAASLSIDGDGTDSTTVFTDGVARYAVKESDTISDEPIFLKLNFGGDLFSPETPASHVVWIDGYFICNRVGTNRFLVSELQSTDLDALSFASSEGDPDIVMGIIDNHRELWVFNEKSTEIYVNTGNADFPFERVQGGFLEIGCAAKFSIEKIDGTIIWLGRSQNGQGVVYAARGINPQRISTHAIEQAISSYSDISSAKAFTYQWKGHKFYVLNFGSATWVYDLTTGLWHERAYTNAGSLERHRADVHCFDINTGIHFVGDYSTGEVYKFNDSYYTDDGDAITRLRAAPHISAGYDRVFCHEFQLDMETGIGLDGDVQGSDPTVMLDYSDDGGHTFSSESWTLADAGSGEIGDYKKRVIWRRLGRFRDRIFRVKITDPVPVTLIAANLRFSKGRG